MDGRSVVLDLTAKGIQTLEDDQLSNLNKTLAGLSDKTAKRFAKGLNELLHSEVKRQGEPSFGTCGNCIHASKKDGAVFCDAMQASVEIGEAQKLCVYHKAKT